jgi:spermidine synthase
MSRSPSAGKAAAAAPLRPFLPLLVLLFIGSGCAALIYEVVWLQMISLIVGSSAISLGVVLGTFMGGMCLGSLLLSRYVSRAAHPMKVYAYLELGIAGFGLLMPFLLPAAGGLYFAVAGSGMVGLMIRGLFCAVMLLGPTLLMGATLPAIARWVQATPKGVSWLGFFYGGNIAGGVIGCLLAGYYLLRVTDATTASFVAVALNVVVAGAALLLAKESTYDGAKDAAAASAPKPPLFAAPPGSWPVYGAIALSGFTALGSEVVWARLLSLNLGGTTYTFSLILGVFLMGLGLGSSVGASVAGSVKDPRSALGWFQLSLMAAIAWAAYALTQAIPFWPVDPTLSQGPWFTFQMDFVKTAFTVLPGAFLWGASFPLALAATAGEDRDPGVMVGTVYAANTVGAIFGAVLASIAFIPAFGTQTSQRLMLVVAGVSALLVLVAFPSASVVAAGAAMRRLAALVVAVGVGGFLVTTVAPVPPLLVGFGRFTARRAFDHGEFIFTGEGMNSSMAVSLLSNGVLNYHNAGKVQASSEPQDMRLQRMLGHLATLLPEDPKSVLVIGFGAGVTAGSVSIDPMVQRQVIAEIEPLVPKVVSTYFGQQNYFVAENPKVEIKVDDARHYLLTTDETFDAITSDPFDPWVKGAATLYTKEFFTLVREKLNPGGIVTVFVQLYESTPEAVKSEVATFFEAFPDGLVFGNTHMGQGYDIVLVGQKEPGPIDVDKIQARLDRPEYEPVRQSMTELGMYSAVDLLATFGMRAADLKPWTADAQINTDRNLRLQYLAGFGLNMYRQAEIYAGMLQYKRWPEGLFTGSPATVAQLRAQMMSY